MKAWVAALLAAFSCLAAAQGFPSKPIRILVPFPPGGGTDVAARALAEHLQRDLGQPVLVDNRSGGNSVIATEAAARAEPDGHTLLLTTDFHSINAAFGLRLPYDSLADFAFVSRVSALKGTEVPARLAGAGVDAAPSTPEELEQWVREDIARYRRIIELTGAKPDGR